jgi:nucleoside-diphosphate-sugar epimerase
VRRVLIAGCGYLGTSAAKLFLRNGWSVEGWTRSGSPIAGMTVHAVDLSEADAVMRSEGEFDVVIHSASTRGGDAADYARVYQVGAKNLLKRFTRSQVIFVGSTSVYAQRDGEWVDETSVAEPTHERGKILRDAEDLILSRDGRVARLAGIYGPGRSALLQRVLSGEATVDQTKDRFVNQVHRDDAASALLRIAQLSEQGRIWNVADNSPFLLSECYYWLAQRLNRTLEEGAPETPRKRGESNKRISNTRLQSSGWIPQYPSFKEGMERSVLPLL